MISPIALDSGATPPSPLREVWSIAWPTVLTMASYTVMQFVDKLMVGQVGPLEVAAQGNGGIWSFTPIAFAMGVLTVVNTYVSQNLGAGTAERAPRYAWAALWLSVIIWLCALMPWGLFVGVLFEWVHAAQLGRLTETLATVDGAAALEVEEEIARTRALVPMETGYARILLAGAIVLMAGKGLHHYFFGLHRPKIVTVSAICGNLTNVGLNYALIFGSAGLVLRNDLGEAVFSLPGVPGAPKLGLYGAAIGTVLGTAIEVAIPMAVFLGPKMNRELNTRAAWRPDPAAIKDLLRIGWPAAVQFGNEIVCWSIFMSALVGLFGTHHQTAGWIALGYMHLSFMPAVGFSVAVTSLVGKYIGAGDPVTAMHRARVGLGIAVLYMTVCGLIFFVFRRPLVAVFIGGSGIPASEAAEIIEIGAKLMICAALFQTVDAFGIVYTGALRGAGDTVWPGVVTIVYAWAFIVAGGWAMTVYWPELESIGPWIAATVYILAFGVTMSWRFESGRWRSINLLDRSGPSGEAARVAPVGPGPPPSDPDAVVRDIATELSDAAAE